MWGGEGPGVGGMGPGARAAVARHGQARAPARGEKPRKGKGSRCAPFRAGTMVAG